jgi:hypothetical protein
MAFAAADPDDEELAVTETIPLLAAVRALET